MHCKRIIISQHAHDQMVDRDISRDALLSVIEHGVVIEEYPHDPRGPSCLLLGYVGDSPLHVCLGVARAPEVCAVITAYVPDDDTWEPGFRTRKGGDT